MHISFSLNSTRALLSSPYLVLLSGFIFNLNRIIYETANLSIVINLYRFQLEIGVFATRLDSVGYSPSEIERKHTR